MISVCMIVKNEENNIAECIESVRNLASEIIIVDNGCTDLTIAIAKKYNCIIIDGKDCIIDEAKRKYLEVAKYPWILTIDADERCEKVNKDILYKKLQKTDKSVWAYTVKEYQYLGLGKWSEISLVRLFRNNGLIKYNDSKIHASLIPSIIDNGGLIEEIPIYFHHLDILYKNRTRNKREIYRNKLLDILNNEVFKMSDPSSYELYKIYLSMEYNAIGKYDDAKNILKDVVKNGRYYKNFAIISLCRTFLLTEEYDEISKYLNINEIDLNSNYGESLDMIDILANYYYEKNKNKSIELYERIILNNKARASDYVNSSFLLMDENYDKGKKYLLKAFKLNPYLNRNVIYEDGEKPNIFDQQSNMLFKMPSVKKIIEYYGLHKMINK